MAARCATDCGIMSVGLPVSQAASPLYGTLAPLRRGFFMRVLGAARNQQRGWALGWWACCVPGGETASPVWQDTRWTHLAPLPMRGAFVWGRALVQPSVSRPVDCAGLLVTFAEWQPLRRQWPASLLIDVQIVHCATDCAIAIVGFASEGQAPLWKIALAPLLGGAFSVDLPRAVQPTGQPPR